MADEKYLEALKMAIGMERKGQKAYSEMAARSRNQLGMKVFAYLAKDEIAHIEAIKEFSVKLAGGRILPDVEKLVTREHHKGNETIFNRPLEELKDSAGIGAGDLKAYKTAMQTEKDGYEFYKECLEGATDEMVKKLFTFLIEEESSHYQILQDTYQYLAHPADWFAKQERPIFEGG